MVAFVRQHRQLGISFLCYAIDCSNSPSLIWIRGTHTKSKNTARIHLQKAPKQTTCTHYTKCKPKESKKSENWEDLFRFQICIAPLFADCHQQCDENCIPDKNTIGGSLCQPFPRSEQLWHNISVCWLSKSVREVHKKMFLEGGNSCKARKNAQIRNSDVKKIWEGVFHFSIIFGAVYSCITVSPVCAHGGATDITC